MKGEVFTLDQDDIKFINRFYNELKDYVRISKPEMFGLDMRERLKQFDDDCTHLITRNQKLRITTKVINYQEGNLKLFGCLIELTDELPEGLIKNNQEIMIDIINYDEETQKGHIISVKVINPTNEILIKSIEGDRAISHNFCLFFGPHLKLFEY